MPRGPLAASRADSGTGAQSLPEVPACSLPSAGRVREGGEWHGSVQLEVAQNVGWDQRRFAAPAHHQFSMFSHAGLALEASWSHPTLKLARAVGRVVNQLDNPLPSPALPAEGREENRADREVIAAPFLSERRPEQRAGIAFALAT